MTRRPLLFILACCVLAWMGSSALHAQTEEEAPSESRTTRSVRAEKDRLNKTSTAAFDRGDFKAAEAVLRELVRIDPDNFVPWYNLACALSSQNRTEEAGPMLEKAIELGFSDLRHMQQDPHLANLRRTENYKRIVENWNDILTAHGDQRLEEARRKYGPKYTYEKDPEHRLAYVSAFPPESFSQVKSEIASLIRWWETYVCPPASADQNGAEQDTTPWILVVLPTPSDYAKWARARYGDNWERIGGVYSHDSKSLIAKDLGSTLRHEFWHVLHWRHMDTLGQRHPTWMMEGLCSLMEDVDVSTNGAARPLASWRTNQAGQLARTGKLTPWEVLFKLDHGKFVGTRPLAFYGQARSIFMWLFENKKLAEWYGAYTANYKEDPTGLSAFERVFGKPVKEVESDYRAWLRKLPIVDEDIPVGGAMLPFGLDPISAGDGLTVSVSDQTEPLGGRRANFSKAGGIMPRDVILAIDDRPVREYAELVRVLADYGPGTQVTVTYRRLKKVSTAKVTLIEKR